MRVHFQGSRTSLGLPPSEQSSFMDAFGISTQTASALMFLERIANIGFRNLPETWRATEKTFLT
jgi:hypothetical protein